MGMRYPIACLCFDVRDEEESKRLLPESSGFEPRFCYWTARKPPVLEDQVALVVVRDYLTLFREVPVLCELYKDKQILVLVSNLREKVAALPEGENLWYADRAVDVPQLHQTLYHLLFGTARKAECSVSLTRREMEVFQLVAAGLTTQEICSSLSICRSTVNTHKKHLFIKFKVRSSAQMVAASSSARYHVDL